MRRTAKANRICDYRASKIAAFTDLDDLFAKAFSLYDYAYLTLDAATELGWVRSENFDADELVEDAIHHLIERAKTDGDDAVLAVINGLLK